jgi:hypothetical protein
MVPAMAVLLSLVLGSLAARIVGWLGVDYVDYVDSWPAAIAVELAMMFVTTGVAHFVPGMRRDMVAIVPPRLPKPALLVTITGVLELLGAVGLPNPPKSMTSRLSVRSGEEVVYLAAAVVVAISGG